MSSHEGASAVREEEIKRQLSKLSADSLQDILRFIQESLLNDPQSSAVPPQAAAANKRREMRLRVVATGTILYHDRTGSMPCDIRDISSLGCRVSVASASDLPRHFELQISGTENVRFCEVKWRLPTELGLLFVDPQV
jgi:hypothetical protein